MSIDGGGWVWFRFWGGEGDFVFKTTSIGERFQDKIYGLQRYHLKIYKNSANCVMRTNNLRTDLYL